MASTVNKTIGLRPISILSSSILIRRQSNPVVSSDGCFLHGGVFGASLRFAATFGRVEPRYWQGIATTPHGFSSTGGQLPVALRPFGRWHFWSGSGLGEPVLR
jgi:hypothetical protein